MHTQIHTCMHTQTHTCTHRHTHRDTTHTYTHTHAHTHKVKKQNKAKSLAAARWPAHRPSEVLGCLGTNQALWASAGKSTWGGLMVPRRWGCSMSNVMVWAPKVPPGSHRISGNWQQFDICFQVASYPLNVSAGWAVSPCSSHQLGSLVD